MGIFLTDFGENGFADLDRFYRCERFDIRQGRRFILDWKNITENIIVENMLRRCCRSVFLFVDRLCGFFLYCA